MFFAENLRLISGRFFFLLLSLSRVHTNTAFLRRRKASVSDFVLPVGLRHHRAGQKPNLGRYEQNKAAQNSEFSRKWSLKNTAYIPAG